MRVGSRRHLDPGAVDRLPLQRASRLDRRMIGDRYAQRFSAVLRHRVACLQGGRPARAGHSQT